MELFKTEIIKEPITKEKFQELIEIEKYYGGLVKVVVDIEKEIISLNCEYHCDCADELYREIETEGAINLWGANIYPSQKRIEYYSLINLRPQDNNRSQEILREDIRAKVGDIINRLIFNNN